MPPRIPSNILQTTARTIIPRRIDHARFLTSRASFITATSKYNEERHLAPRAWPQIIRELPIGTRYMSGPPPHATNSSITVDEYHKLADSSLEAMLDAFEWMAESDETVKDVEYSNHVLTLSVPKGVYVFNKQPPTMQLWLSSPVSGPKRYDWDADKETWVYLRDGTLLEDLLTEELGVDVDFADLD